MPIYILEAEIVLGVLYRKGVIPKKGGTLDSREVSEGHKWGGQISRGRHLLGEASIPTSMDRHYLDQQGSD